MRGKIPSYGQISFVKFTLIGQKNLPPTIDLKDWVISWNKETIVYLQQPYDPNGDDLTVFSAEDKHSVLPSFMTFDSTRLVYTCNPNLVSMIKNYTIRVTVKDLLLSYSGTFILSVKNTAPKFQTRGPRDQRIELGKVLSYNLPTTIDEE